MPSTRDIKRLVRPLLKRRPDLKCDKRAVFFAPLTHYLRGVIFEQGFWTRHFRVWAYTRQLFNGDHFMDTMVEENHLIEFRHEWTEDWEGTSQRLCDHIEQVCLPAVEPMTSPREHRKEANYVGGKSLASPKYNFRAAVGACFDGDFDLAESLTTDFSSLIRDDGSDGLPDKLHFNFLRRNRYLLKLLREDRSAIPALLREWEEFSVKTIGLTKYWSASPFPCDKQQ